MEHGIALFYYVAFLKLADALTVLGVWFLAWSIRFHSNWIPIPKGIPHFDDYARVALPLALVFSAVLHLVGAYRRDRVHFGFRSLKKIAEGSVLGTLVFISICYFLGTTDYSRAYLALFPVLAFVGLMTQRAISARVWSHLERKSILPKTILLLGHGEHLTHYIKTLSDFQPYPHTWLGRLGPKSAHAEAPVPYLGEESRLLSFLAAHRVDGIVVSYPAEEGSRYADLLETLSNEPVAVKILPDFGKYSTFTYSAQDECGIPSLVFNEAPLGGSDRFFKRAVDILGASAFLLLASPLYLLIALGVKLSSRGPVFYSQTRLGADGRLFPCYKFRSMRADAETMTGAVWATKDDSRVTAFGRFLRQTSLDEIPQFYNVLIGHMSLVGPRPERPVFVDQFRKEIPKYMLRHRMRSGITGWAQVNGWRGNTSIEERIKHDLYYIGHWSLRFDLKILGLTVLRGFVHKNAY